MESALIIRGRPITSTDLEIIRALAAEYGDQSRSYISKKLAETWHWHQPNGKLKIRSCLDILTALESRGLITLPPRCVTYTRRYHVRPLTDPPAEIDTSLIRGTVKGLKPFRFQVVFHSSLEALWNYLVTRYHYLGYRMLVGTHLKYLVFSGPRVVAALGWSSAVWKLKARDIAIGWSGSQKRAHLHRIANNTRFLMLPWVDIPCAASHILSQTVRRLNKDWFERYNYRLWILEAFVDPDRFKGICYRAANWINVGQTRGFRKQGNTFQFHGHRKEVFLYPLQHNFRTQIGCDSPLLPPLDHTYRPFIPEDTQRGETKMILRHAGWNPNMLPPFDINEEDIESIVDEFEHFHACFEDVFYRIEQSELSQCYLQGLMSPLKRKSMEPIAISLMNTHRVRSLQHFLSTGKWDGELLAQRYKEEAAGVVADPLGIYNVDGSDFPKKGKESVGVSRQYCGRLGKVENCQAGVFLGYSSPRGYILLDRRLFLPEAWFTEDYKDRWQKCKIPDDVRFQTKPELAAEMIKDVHSSGLFPASWVTCDTAFGNNPGFLDNLPDDLYYLAEVPSNTHLWRTQPNTWIPPYCGKGRHPKKVRVKEGEPNSVHVSEIAKDPSIEWDTVTLDEGAKGPITARIARTRVVESRDALPGKERWLFIRHCPHSNETKYFLSNATEDIAIEEMTRVCILRWPIEQCFKEGKSEIGMDHYEHRSWTAWHRHMTFVFIAQLFLLRLRHKLKKNSSSHATTSMPSDGDFAADKTL